MHPEILGAGGCDQPTERSRLCRLKSGGATITIIITITINITVIVILIIINEESFLTTVLRLRFAADGCL